MRFWAFLKQFPKFVLVAAVLIVSTGLFALWWFNHSLKPTTPATSSPQPDMANQAAQVQTNFGRMVLADNDLYNIETGELVFKNWLKEGMPLALFFDPATQKLIARYPRGFVRYNLAGTEERSIFQKTPVALFKQGKSILYVKDGDIWRADIDWKEFKLVNEKQVTSIGQFIDAYFAESVLMGTDKILLVRNMNQILRVNLDTGETHPMNFPMVGIKQRSPSGQYLIGEQNGTLFCYDLDTDKIQTLAPQGRVGFNDYQWLDDQRCALIENGTSVKLYDREKNTLSPVADLPVSCRHLILPSSDGGFAFCANDVGQGILIDFKKQKAIPVEGGAGLGWADEKTFMFSRDVQDSTLRGSWMQTAGETERRVSPQPYFVYRNGSSLLPLEKAGQVIFIEKNNLTKIGIDGQNLKQVASLRGMPSSMIGVTEWKP